jgi:hypothetical protein
MIFGIMVATQRIPAMIAAAAVPGVGEQDVLILVIADPLPTTFCPGQVARFAAQAASGGSWFSLLPLSFLSLLSCHFSSLGSDDASAGLVSL